MRKYLLSETGNYYKANLHCHTNFSDGKWSPQELKEAYVEKGYSIVAFTDHNVFIPHPELNDEEFLVLNGFEADITETVEWGPGMTFAEAKTCHICYIAMRPDIELHPFWHRTRYLYEGAIDHKDEVKFDESQRNYYRHYSPECINDMIMRGRDNGFFVTYNHPTWSMETYQQYIRYENMHAMEIYNHECYLGGYQEYNPHVYDEMLRSGKHLYCLATDDSHSAKSAFGGYVMIRAEKLEYGCVMDALAQGNFYSSRGPKIKNLWYDDENKTVHVECSEAVKIIYTCGIRKPQVVTASSDGDASLTEATFEVHEEDRYFRITIFDKNQLTADTNAYFVDEL